MPLEYRSSILMVRPMTLYQMENGVRIKFGIQIPFNILTFLIKYQTCLVIGSLLY